MVGGLRGILEIARVIFLFIIFYLITGNIFAYIYKKLGTGYSVANGFMLIISIFILFLVIYRNKLQFSGWYKGKGREKLSKKATKWLISSATFLFLVPPILSFLLN